MAIQRDKIVASAEKLVAKGKVEAAIKEYDRLLDDNPNDVNTLNRIGDLWVRINRTDEAVKVFTRIADHYSKDGFFLKAIAIFKKINKLDPSRLEIYARLADLYAKQGLAMEAKGQYQVLADYYLKHGDPDNALKTYQKIAELDPNSINVHVKLADLFSQNGRTADALKEYDRVGRMLLKRGMTEEAVQVFRKALKIDPKNVDLAESLANTLIEAKDFANARQLLDGAIEGNPDNPRLVALLGKVHIGKGDLAAAERVLSEAVARNPGEASVTELLADLYLRRGKADAALNVLEPLVDAAAERGDRSAVELLQRVTRVSAAHIPALEKLVHVYERLNEETNILSSMNSLAEAHISSGNMDSAAEVLERLIKREPENAQHREKLSFVRGKGTTAPPPPAPKAAPKSPPPPAPPEDDFQIGGDDFALSIDVEEPGDSSYASPPPLPPPPAIPEPRAIEPAEHEPEDLDFITEQLTEAEVFAKYGLTEKAIEHLERVLERSPNNLSAYEKLLRIHMDEGNGTAVTGVATRYLGLLGERGETETADTLRSELASRGFSVPGGGAPAVLPEPEIGEEAAEEIAEEAVEEIDSAALEEIEEIPEGTPELELDEAAELVPEKAEAEIDLSGISEPDVEIETDVEVEVEAEAEPDVEIEAEIELDVPEGQAHDVVEIETEAPAAAAPPAEPEPSALEEEAELTFDETPELSFETGAGDQEIAGLEPEAPPEPRMEEMEIPEEPAPSVPTEPAMEELGEVDFYIEQDLLDEAAERLVALEERFPGDVEVRNRREELENRRAAAAVTTPAEPLEAETDLLSEIREEVEEEITAEARADEANLFDEEEDFFDLAAELEQELTEDEEPISISEEEQSLEEIFKEFKRGVEQQLDAEDYDTHYNLGIAYKEMGLIDEAIGEFQLAAKDPKRAIECCSMLGLCFLEKGMPQLAIKWYQKGLETPEIRDEEHLGLLYDLGSAYLEVGDTSNAQKAFLEVYGINSNYRDIVNRIKQLEDVAQ